MTASSGTPAPASPRLPLPHTGIPSVEIGFSLLDALATAARQLSGDPGFTEA